MSAALPLAMERSASEAREAVIGKGVIVKGQIQSREDLTIQGEVEGTIEISGHRLTIDGQGSVRAGVKARTVEVQGCIEGQVEAADKVYIRKGAKFVGDIRSGGIIIEDGGYIQGKVDLSQRAGGKAAVNGTGGVLEAVAS
ncbi:MAG TPA: polymer-forming cytoskeletal protein [Bryobacteraceae bacterium]|nr:polymer-forming cytoskeletal protein [Bryobacteraceae bacterium]